MHFAFTEEQVMVAETAKSFFAEFATSDRTRAAIAGEGVDHDLWSRFAGELGLAGVAIPGDFGGAGLGMVEAAILAEVAGATLAALPFLASLCMAAPAILAGGSEAQKASWLPRLASGEAIGSFAPVSGISAGDRVSGTAEFVPHGAVADLFVLEVGIGVALVESDADGVHIEARATMDGTRPLARLTLTNAPVAWLDHPEAASRAARQHGAVGLAADALGGAQACLDRTVGYAMERVQFGRPIGSFQAVKHRLADMMVLIEQARSAVYWAACAIDEGSEDSELAVHAAKAFACDTYRDCAGAMIQLHGGIGFTWEHDAHLFFKRAQADRSLLGTPEEHQEAVARLIMPGLAA